MTPQEFEQYVSERYQELGYKTILTPYSGDWGIDVIAMKGNEKIAIQAKMYGGSSRKVNRQVMMQLYGAMAYQDCTKAVLATDGECMADAVEVANKLGIEILYLNGNEDARQMNANKEPVCVENLQGRTILPFGDMWEKFIMPLAGKALKGGNRENRIVSVDWGGIVRITSNGKRSKISIEDVKMAYGLLQKQGYAERSAIDQFANRCSSGIALLLSQVPFIGIKKNPTTLFIKETNEL